MAEGFVKLRSFWSPDEANLARLQLESHGITAELESATFVSTAWLDANAVGGVKLLVKNTDIDRAEEILSLKPGIESDEAKEDDGNDSESQVEYDLGEESSGRSGVLSGFRSLKQVVIWFFLGLFLLPIFLYFGLFLWSFLRYFGSLIWSLLL